LFPWHDDFTAIRGKHADGSFLQFGKSDIGNAAGKESDAGAPPSYGRKRRPNATEEKIIIDAREEAVTLGKAEQLENADAASDSLQAGSLIEAEEAGGVFDKMGSRKELLENEVPGRASEPGALVTAFDAGARVLHQFSVFHARRAGRLASAAVEAFVDVIDEAIGDAGFPGRLAADFSLKNVEHLLDAASRRIRLEIPQPIGGASIEAQATVDAASVVLVDRRRTRDGIYMHGVRL
jgi:hypothetical protein